MALPKFTPSVGVTPGTSVVIYSPYADPVRLRGLHGLREIDTRAHIRWDIIGAIGGGALVISLFASLIANAMD